MTPEATKLYERLTKISVELDKAKRLLEELREAGEKQQQTVTALRSEEHFLKDQLAALAKKEAEEAAEKEGGK